MSQNRFEVVFMIILFHHSAVIIIYEIIFKKNPKTIHTHTHTAPCAA